MRLEARHWGRKMTNLNFWNARQASAKAISSHFQEGGWYLASSGSKAFNLVEKALGLLFARVI